jgi:uncharacterized protein YlxW (UPF0749 family)
MSLLVDMMTNTQDQAYADAAARRRGDAARRSAPAPSTRPTLARRALAVLLLLVLGLLTGTAAAQVKRRDAGTSGVRAQLAADVHRRTAESDALAAQAGRLRQEVARARDAALSSGVAGRAAVLRLQALELATGIGAVTGPGVVVHVDDAPGSAAADHARGGQFGQGRVLDRDLQDIVNGLWAAGAEAISINGLRLTSRTAIRSAGEAILVDYRPLSPPYTVRALGDPGVLGPAFADGPAGRRLATYSSLYGLRFTVDRSESQTLAGAASPDLRAATPVQGSS